MNRKTKLPREFNSYKSNVEFNDKDLSLEFNEDVAGVFDYTNVKYMSDIVVEGIRTIIEHKFEGCIDYGEHFSFDKKPGRQIEDLIFFKPVYNAVFTEQYCDVKGAIMSEEIKDDLIRANPLEDGTMANSPAIKSVNRLLIDLTVMHLGYVCNKAIQNVHFISKEGKKKTKDVVMSEEEVKSRRKMVERVEKLSKENWEYAGKGYLDNLPPLSEIITDINFSSELNLKNSSDKLKENPKYRHTILLKMYLDMIRVINTQAKINSYLINKMGAKEYEREFRGVDDAFDELAKRVAFIKDSGVELKHFNSIDPDDKKLVQKIKNHYSKNKTNSKKIYNILLKGNGLEYYKEQLKNDTKQNIDIDKEKSDKELPDERTI